MILVWSAVYYTFMLWVSLSPLH